MTREEQRILNWFGHVIKKNNNILAIQKKRDRPRKMLLQQMEKMGSQKD